MVQRLQSQSMTGPLPDEDRFRLVGGPYLPPDVRPGDWLFDAERGSVEVGGYTTTAPIPWPRLKKTGKASLILCGDLIRAVQTESALAIMHWWGVSTQVVWRWRKILGVSQTGSEGTRRLYQQYKSHKLPEEVAARGRENALLPENKAKMIASKIGNPMHPQTRAALWQAVKRPKSDEWIAKHKNNMLQQWEEGVRNRTPVWTPEADAELLEWHEQGLTAREIGHEMGKTRLSILGRLARLRKKKKSQSEKARQLTSPGVLG